jgi:hypothetical protein
MVREGTDVSIFTYSRMRYVVMQAVAELEKRGYNPEVRACAPARLRAARAGVLLGALRCFFSRQGVCPLPCTLAPAALLACARAASRAPAAAVGVCVHTPGRLTDQPAHRA